MQKSTVLEKNDFDQFEVQVVTVLPSRLGKTQTICIFAYGRFFYTFNTFFEFFERFLKIIRITC